MKVFDILKKSENDIKLALSKEKYTNELNDLPKILEVFSFFYEMLEKHPNLQANNLPALPKDLKEVQPGIYFKNGFIVCASPVTSEEFKYKALYSGSLANQSCIQSELSGVYLNILKVTADGFHVEPSAFSYLLRDEFFSNISTRFVVPFLILNTVIPEPLEFQWPYLAMKELSQQLSPLIEYRYLVTSDEELRLLVEWGQYPDK